MLWIHPPRQSRSRATSDRIAGTVAELLKEKEFDEITVPEIVERAGVSVGGFYSRFPSKEAVLLHLFGEQFFGDFSVRADALLEESRWTGCRASEIAAAYVRMMVALFTEHAALLRQVSRLIRTGDDASLRERVIGFNQGVHERLRDLLLARRKEISHPRPEVAVDLAILMVSATAREMVLHRGLWPYINAGASARLEQELTRMFCAALGLGDTSRRRR